MCIQIAEHGSLCARPVAGIVVEPLVVAVPTVACGCSGVHPAGRTRGGGDSAVRHALVVLRALLLLTTTPATSTKQCIQETHLQASLAHALSLQDLKCARRARHGRGRSFRAVVSGWTVLAASKHRNRWEVFALAVAFRDERSLAQCCSCQNEKKDSENFCRHGDDGGYTKSLNQRINKDLLVTARAPGRDPRGWHCHCQSQVLVRLSFTARAPGRDPQGWHCHCQSKVLVRLSFTARAPS